MNSNSELSEQEFHVKLESYLLKQKLESEVKLRFYKDIFISVLGLPEFLIRKVFNIIVGGRKDGKQD